VSNRCCARWQRRHGPVASENVCRVELEVGERCRSPTRRRQPPWLTVVSVTVTVAPTRLTATTFEPSGPDLDVRAAVLLVERLRRSRRRRSMDDVRCPPLSPRESSPLTSPGHLGGSQALNVVASGGGVAASGWSLTEEPRDRRPGGLPLVLHRVRHREHRPRQRCRRGYDETTRSGPMSTGETRSCWPPTRRLCRRRHRLWR
jgi:hypothetical protein